jgi:hypothetical protein
MTSPKPAHETMPNWPPSSWNGGRDQIVIGGRLRWNPHRDTSILVFRILNGFLTDKFKMVAGEGNAAVCAWERFYAFPSAVPSALIELGLNRVKDLSVLHRSSSWHPPITADE